MKDRSPSTTTISWRRRRLTSAPERETPYLRGAFEHALAVVKASSDPVERMQASHVAHLLSFAVFPLHFDERLATDVMSLLGLRLAEGDTSTTGSPMAT